MKNDLKGYAQPYRAGITMKQKWAMDRQIAAEKKEYEVTRQKAASGAPMMGKNE